MQRHTQTVEKNEASVMSHRVLSLTLQKQTQHQADTTTNIPPSGVNILRGIIISESIYQGTRQDVQHSAEAFAAWQTSTQED